MHNIDLLIDGKWIVTANHNNDVFQQHSIAVDKGRIVDILPTTIATDRYIASQHLQYDEHVLMPGFINCHTHTAMSLFKGLADDLPLMEWLEKHIWPAESKWVNEEFIHDGTELAIAEMIRSGTTCFNDMYFFPDVSARVAETCGMRASIGMIMLDFPTVWAQNPDEYLEKGLKLRDAYRSHPLINTAFAPHAPYTVSDEPLKHIRVLSDEMDLPVHMHLHETQLEVDTALTEQGKKPLQRLDEIGLLSPNMLAVHMTALDDEDINLLAERGCHVVHCPESNMKLASGLCPVDQLHNAGINVALGTDGSASNNDLDMFGEMRSAAFMAKIVSGNAASMAAASIIRMATINGAKALGIQDETGSLEVDKSADIIAVDFSELESHPVYDPVSTLVYNTSRNQVSDVWIAGKHQLKQRKLVRLDEAELIRKSTSWNAKIAEN